MAVDPPGRRATGPPPADLLVFSQDAARARDLVGGSAARRGRGGRADQPGPGDDREPRHQRRCGRPRDVPALHAARDRRAPGGLGAGGRRRARDRPAAGGAADRRERATCGSASAATPPTIHVGAFAHADPAGRRGRQREVGRGARDDLRQRAAHLHGARARSRVRPAVAESSGTKASVQRSTSRPGGLDTSVQQTAFLTGGSVAAVVGTFNYTRARRRPDRTASSPGSTRTSAPRRCPSWGR